MHSTVLLFTQPENRFHEHTQTRDKPQEPKTRKSFHCLVENFPDIFGEEFFKALES